MLELKVFLFGPPYIVYNGKPVKVERRKAIALLAYLAYTGVGHTRDALATLFWPESSQAQARTALRKALLVLREVLGAEWLEIERENLALKRNDDFELDVDRFRNLLASCQDHGHPPDKVCPTCLIPLTKAVSLYRDDFMAGFTLRGSNAFDDWQSAQSERLRRELSNALERLVYGHSIQGEFEQAITYAQRRVALDPLYEPAHCDLMRLYAQAGQRAFALRQYKECEQILQVELGVPPQKETAQLYHTLRESDGTQVPGLVQVCSTLPPHNLPLQPMPFIGRERELAEIDQLLRDPACRLLTLTGVGGSGKSRLALQAARAKIGSFQHGVYFIPLAPLSSADLLVPTIAQALQFSLRGATDPQTQLFSYLQEKEMLLLLDNFEHLVSKGGTTLLVEMLRHIPRVKLLVTSRERLNLQWEWPLEIQGLRFPQDGETVTTDTIKDYSAVQMFLQRARKADPRFSPSADEKEFIARICRSLEGMPLGIELAALWVELFSCQEIAQEIERNLALFATSLQDVPPRHRSLQATFDYSWSLLSDEEKSVFKKLSVFRGGFWRDAVERVTGASLSLLSNLMHKSFVYTDALGRYQILEVLRQYAAEKLESTPEERNETRDRHCEYFAGFLYQREENLRGKEKKQALQEIEQEIENVRAGWQWAIKNTKIVPIGKYLESLYYFYWTWSWFQEGEKAFAEAVEKLENNYDVTNGVGEENNAVLGRLYARQATFCRELAHYEKAKELLQMSLDTFRRLGDQAEEGRSLTHLATIAWKQGECTKAKQLFQEALALHKKTGDKRRIASCINGLGIVAAMSGEFAQAKQLFQQNLATAQEIGDPQKIASCCISLGRLAEVAGEYKESKQYHHKALTICKELGDRWGVAACFNNLGCLAEVTGEYKEAKRFCQQGLAIFKEIGDRWEIAGSLINLGFAINALGECGEARQCFYQALAIATDIQAMPLTLEILVGVAVCLQKEGEKEPAVELVSHVLTHPAVCEPATSKAKRLFSELQAQLPEQIFSAAQERGETGTLEYFTQTYGRVDATTGPSGSIIST